MKYKLSLLEQETIILYNQGEKDAEIYTHDPKLIKKLKEHPEVANLKTSNEFGGYTFTVSKKELVVKLKQHYTGERRENVLKHIKKVNEQNRSRFMKNKDVGKDNTPPEKFT